jgi:hypothetical protein
VLGVWAPSILVDNQRPDTGGVRNSGEHRQADGAKLEIVRHYGAGLGCLLGDRQVVGHVGPRQAIRPSARAKHDARSLRTGRDRFPFADDITLAQRRLELQCGAQCERQASEFDRLSDKNLNVFQLQLDPPTTRLLETRWSRIATSRAHSGNSALMP